MIKRCVTGCVFSVLVLTGALVPGVASAAPPTIERVAIDETFNDDDLTQACGVAVTTRAEGRLIVRTFSREGTGLVEVLTVNVVLTSTADGRVFRSRDVGANVTRIEPDGTAVLSISGQIPFDFAGVLKIDLETGEAILEPRDRSEEQLARACAVLTAG